jgi:hypothetical protein
MFQTTNQTPIGIVLLFDLPHYIWNQWSKTPVMSCYLLVDQNTQFTQQDPKYKYIFFKILDKYKLHNM